MIHFYLESERGEKSVCIQLEDIECELVFIDRPRTEISVSSFLTRDRTDILYQREDLGRIYCIREKRQDGYIEIGRINYIREKRQDGYIILEKRDRRIHYRKGRRDRRIHYRIGRRDRTDIREQALLKLSGKNIQNNQELFLT